MAKGKAIIARNYEKMRYDDVSLKAADNGYVLNFTEHTPAAKNSESQWDYKQEVFTNEQVEKAMARLKELHNYNKSLKQ
jgi:hypothetical protein